MSDQKLKLTPICNYGSGNYSNIDPKADNKSIIEPLFKLLMTKIGLNQIVSPLNTNPTTYGSV